MLPRGRNHRVRVRQVVRDRLFHQHLFSGCQRKGRRLAVKMMRHGERQPLNPRIVRRGFHADEVALRSPSLG